jgi:hypothetical protein
MKTRLTRKVKQMASSLLTTLVICTILSMFVMYYLSLIDQQSYLSSRSQLWNMAIAASEAGIEDGLQEINSNDNYPNLAGDGWTGSNNVWTRTNALPDGNNYVVTVIATNNNNPIVLSRGYVYNIPRYGRNGVSSFFAAIAVPAQGSDTVTRAVAVTCTRTSLFGAALIAKEGIDLSGNGVYTDSFDSSMPGIKSDLNGRYNASIYTGDHGDIGTNGGLTNGSSINVGNANIYGTVHTGPGCPVAIGSQGRVGPHCCYATTVPQAINRGYIVQDSNFTFPDTVYPNTAGYLTPPPGYLLVVSNWVVSYATNVGVGTPHPPEATPICGAAIISLTPPIVPCCSIVTNYFTGNYTYVPITGYSWTFARTNSIGYTNYYDHILFGNGCSALGGLGTLLNPYTICPVGSTRTNRFVSSNLSGQTAVIGTNIVLALPNGLLGVENFKFAQQTALLLYAGNSSVTTETVSGNGYVNPNGAATSFIVFCPPSVTSFSFSGNGQFTGVFVAPNAYLNLSGGGSGNEDFCGCVMMSSIHMNGHFSFHWDEGLVRANINGRFLVKSWNEVK